MTNEKTRLLVAVSDLHCGSDCGLMPEDAELHSGNTVGFGDNYAQAWLWDCWQIAQAKIGALAEEDPYVLLINGDCTEGIHHGSADLIASKIETHTNMAIECLRPLADSASSVLVTMGTECHTRGMEDIVAERLEAEGEEARAKWLFRVNGVLCDATHHVGVTSRRYLEASQLSIAMGNAQENALRAGHEVPRVFLRGHRHCGGAYDDGFSLMCVTGGWQMLTRHGYKVVPDSISRPTVIVLDWRTKEYGELPVVHQIVFNPPQPSILEV
jgi:hypothetical protein